MRTFRDEFFKTAGKADNLLADTAKDHRELIDKMRAQAAEIRAAKGTGTYKALAQRFGTSPTNVWNIQNGKRWIRL